MHMEDKRNKQTLLLCFLAVGSRKLCSNNVSACVNRNIKKYESCGSVGDAINLAHLLFYN